MSQAIPTHGLQLRSLVRKSGELELSLARVEVAAPGPDEVVVRIEAAPINPSDLALLVGAADMGTATMSGPAENPVTTAQVPPAGMRAMGGRLDESMTVGNEGAGTVIAAGSSETAQRLMGRTVAVFGGSMFGQYRTLRADTCLPLPADATAADGASSFVNPMTALCMVETMRLEGHTALVHTAAASNLGQMLVKVCKAEGIALVNIVRSEAQAGILRDLGATHICDSTSPTFMADLIAALVETGATRHGLGRRRLAVAGLPGPDRDRADPGLAPAGRVRAEDHFRQPLCGGNLAGRRAEPRDHRPLQQTGHGREISDQPEPRRRMTVIRPGS